MHKLTVTLKQHTPLIHFQHDQEGATLRASEVKPKLDRFIITRLGSGYYEAGKKWIDDNHKEWWVGKGDHPALDYKMKIITDKTQIQNLLTNEKRLYKDKDERKDKEKGKNIRVVKYGDIVTNANSKENRYIIKLEGKRYFAKIRKEDSKAIYDLNPYPCFFANMDSDIMDSDEYKKMCFTDEPVEMSIHSKYPELISIIDNSELLHSFFLNHNFGTRQSKGFGSFYIDKTDSHYIKPTSKYFFNLPVDGEFYDDDYRTIFNQIDLFSKTLRAGLNIKKGKKTSFYFKSLAFMYCKDILKSKWDKKCLKSQFYFHDMQSQMKDYDDDEAHEVLFFNDGDGYDIRDMLGFSTNEEWQSYKDSIEKKVAITKDNKLQYPKKDEALPVERMRSPLLIKPICREEEDGIYYDIYLVFQDNMVGMDDFKKQRKICFYSKKEKDQNNHPKRFMIDIPQDFSMESYFNYIFRELNFDISSHVEEQYQDREEYEILENIYSQLNENLK